MGWRTAHIKHYFQPEALSQEASVCYCQAINISGQGLDLELSGWHMKKIQSTLHFSRYTFVSMDWFLSKTLFRNKGHFYFAFQFRALSLYRSTAVLPAAAVNYLTRYISYTKQFEVEFTRQLVKHYLKIIGMILYES